MRTFRNLAIQQKLVAIIMATTSAALLLACVGFICYELVMFRMSVSSEMTTIAQLICESSSAAVQFGDAKATSETLLTLRAEPRILNAAIYDREGKILATFHREKGNGETPQLYWTEGTYFSGNALIVVHRILLDREAIGTVVLEVELRELPARLYRYAGIAGAVLLASWLVAFAVSSFLQKVISAPILQLAETAGRVSAESNYSIRATKYASDEIGVLVDRFNEMMNQIKSRDHALRLAQDRLEDRVASRTRELQNEIVERCRIEEDLLAAKEAAEASNRAKSTFLATMSHELRTPLNAIIGYSEMIEEEFAGGDPEGTLVPDVRRIQFAGRHLLSLINDVLDLSKIEAGKMGVKPEMIDIAEALGDIFGTMEPLARKNNNRIVVHVENFTGSMYADRMRFNQCLLNLLSNSCKFTENGTVTLDFERRIVDGTERVYWHVADTGIGISPENLTKLFRSFSQVDSSTTRQFGGTGLGLAISRKLCQMMGGDITVRSTVGEGSVFTISLPAGAVERQAATLSIAELRRSLEPAGARQPVDAGRGV